MDKFSSSEGEHGIKRTFLVGLDVDPHTPIPMIPTEPSSSRSRSPIRSGGKSRGTPDAQGEHGIKRGLFFALDVDPHTPIPMTPVKAATGLAEEDDVSISQAFRHETPVQLPPHNVIFKIQPLVFVPFIGVCIPLCWILIFFIVDYKLTPRCMSGTCDWH
jgi:hypothetical protein